MKFEVGETYITKDGSRAKIKMITSYAMVGSMKKATDHPGMHATPTIWYVNGTHHTNPGLEIIMKETEWHKHIAKYPDSRIQKALNRAIINCELPNDKRQMLVDEFWAIIKNLEALENSEGRPAPLPVSGRNAFLSRQETDT